MGCHLQPYAKTASKWSRWISDSGEKPVVGLFWRSSLPSHSARHKQSELDDWLTRLSGLDLRIVPLQYDLSEQEHELLLQDDRILLTPVSLDLKHDLDEVFGLLAALPIIVALPGTTQHMAGAVGTQVLCACHPYEARWRRVYGRNHDIWAPSVEIISGKLEDGLSGSMDMTVERLKDWIEPKK